MPLLNHIFMTQRKATISIWIVALGLVALIAGGGFRPCILGGSSLAQFTRDIADMAVETAYLRFDQRERA